MITGALLLVMVGFTAVAFITGDPYWFAPVVIAGLMHIFRPDLERQIKSTPYPDTAEGFANLQREWEAINSAACQTGSIDMDEVNRLMEIEHLMDSSSWEWDPDSNMVVSKFGTNVGD